MSEARHAAATAAFECGLCNEAVHDVRLAVTEAVTNAVIHAHAGQIDVTVRAEHGELLIVVGDDGTGMRPRTDSPGLGLGLPVMAAVTKRFETAQRPRGAEVHLTFPCPAAA